MNLMHIRVFPKWIRNLVNSVNLVTLGECEKSLKHELGSI